MNFMAISAILAVALLGWAWAFWSAPPPDWSVDEPVPQAEIRSRIAEVESMFGALSRKTHSALWCTTERALVLSRTLPALGLLLLTAFLAGLLMRELARTSFRFASPTWSYLGKRLAVLAMVAFVVVPFLPCHNPPWAAFAAAGSTALGVAVYVGNLPVKI